MAESEKLFGGKMPIRVLVAEEHSHNSRDGKGIQDPCLFCRGEFEAGEVAVNERKPAAPDEKLQDHHEEQAEADGGIHTLLAWRRVGEGGVTGKYRGKCAAENPKSEGRKPKEIRKTKPEIETQ